MNAPARTLAAVALVALGGALPASAQPAPYTIDVVLPMTGQAAYSGQAESQALDALERYINAGGGVRGQKIHFDIKDDQTSPQVALQLANAAIARKAPVLLGSAVVATCSSIGPVVAQSGPVSYCFSPGYSPPKDSYAFASSVTIANLTKAILGYAKQRGFRRIAFVASTDATGVASAAANADAFKLAQFRDLQVVADERISTGDVSAAAQATKIKAAQPDAIYTTTSGTVFGTLIHALSDAGLNVPVITTTANANRDQLKALAAYLPRDLYFNGFPYQLGDALKSRPLREQGAIFAAAFKLTGVEPTALHALAWDPALIVISALRTFGPQMTADQLKTYLLNLHGFAGLNGIYDFRSGDQHGLDDGAVVIIGWDNQKGEFYPASQPGGAPIRR